MIVCLDLVLKRLRFNLTIVELKYAYLIASHAWLFRFNLTIVELKFNTTGTAPADSILI